MDLFDLFVKLDLDDSEFQNGLDNVGKAVSAAGTAITAAVGAATGAAAALVKESVSAYGQYEQLIGGVETLFSNLEGTISAAPTVLENANNAFKTAGMSANQYMETVTSFSAALISSLEGDYDKAAEISDMAITDIADNANKMGSSLESLQTAYAGFAKQNYTMLDNLKLGYGGTKAEMERLLKDAEKFSGIKYDISNLSDVYEAIHVVQEQMGIAGATAEEAATTIEGSFNQLSGAWENFIAGLANSDADLDGLINDLIESAEILLGNLEPVIQTAVQSLISAVEQFAPALVDKLPNLINDILPPLLDAATSIINALVNALPDTLNSIIKLVPDVINDIVGTIADLLPDIVQAGIDMVVSLADGMSETLPELIPVVVDAVLSVADTIVDNIDTIVDAGIKILMAIADGLTDSLPKLIAKIPAIVVKLGTAFTDNIDKLNHVPQEIIEAIADGLVHTDWTETANAMMDGLIAALDIAQKKVKLWIDKAREQLTGESIYDGDITNVPTTEFVENLEENKDIVVNAVDRTTGEIRQSYDSYYGVLEENGVAASNAYGAVAETQRQAAEDYAERCRKTSQKVIKANNSATKNVVEETEQDEKEMEKALKAYFLSLETQMLDNGYSEEWLIKQQGIYIDALDHNTDLYKKYYNQLLKQEKKLHESAEKQRNQAIKEEAQRTKNALLEKFQDIETFAVKNDKTEEWLLQQERMYIETLDKSSNLYKEYDLKITKQEKKLSEDLQKQRKENAKENQKSFSSMIDEMIKNAKTKISEYEKLVENVKTQIKSFAEKLTTSYKDMFEFTVDEKTGKMSAKKTQDFLTNRIHQMEEYYENIQKLREKGISESMLNQLSDMSAEEGAAVAEYWMKLDDSELKKLDKVWERYEKTGQKISETLYSDEMADAEQKLDSERNTILGEIKNTIDEKLGEVVTAVSEADFGKDGGGLSKFISDMNSTVNDLNTKIESTFGQGFSVTIDGKQLVGAILPNINSGLGSVTRAGMRGAT